MESKGINRTKENGKMGYSNYYANERNVYPDHYIRSASTLRPYIISRWNNTWKQWIHEYSKEWKDIEFTQGYSTVNTEDRDNLIPIRINFITTSPCEMGSKIVIYRGGIYETELYK